MKIGDKRNLLLSMATGKYVAFIDDDDMVPEYYIQRIIDVIKEEDVDVIGINGTISIMYRQGIKSHHKFFHTIRNQQYYESNRGFERPPNHLNPMRRDIAVQFTFPGSNLGEDTDWAMKICRSGKLKKEHYIQEPMYFYDYNMFKID